MQNIIMPSTRCPGCGEIFIITRKGKRYCSKSCRVKHECKWKSSGIKGVCAGTVGAIAELVVSTDLLKRGFAVFRALSPSCSCDLVILKSNKLLRLEVKTGYRNPQSGKIVTPQSKTKNTYDILAAVVGEEIIYVPAI